MATFLLFCAKKTLNDNIFQLGLNVNIKQNYKIVNPEKLFKWSLIH